MDRREALVALNMIDHVGPVRVRQLLEAFGDGPSVLKASKTKLQQVGGIGEETAEAISHWEQNIDLGAELKRIEDYKCQIITVEDEFYPPLLKEIYDPPIVLYIKGELRPSDKQGIAIVGSRLTTPYGLETARRLAFQLAYTGVLVVSGGARGIDTAAHQGALNAKGRTIAVLGAGINIVFPPDNLGLFEKIAENGALMTQFPFNRPADRQTFPIRNRIVAGMTLGTLVVEANLTSGALITANMAVEYGRQVFAVPGRIDSPRSKGCHELIKRGAKLCEGTEDILSEFEYLFPQSNRLAKGNPEKSSGEGIHLNETEQKLVAALKDGDLSMEEVIIRTGLHSANVSVGLVGLEMKHVIRQLPGKRYMLLRSDRDD